MKVSRLNDFESSPTTEKIILQSRKSTSEKSYHKATKFDRKLERKGKQFGKFASFK